MALPLFDQQYYRRHPYGSASLGTESDIRALPKDGSPVARLGKTIIPFERKYPVGVFGGAGSGKFGTIGGYVFSHPWLKSIFCLDPGGQYFSTSWHWNLALGREAYAINPEGAGAYPDINHSFDLWSILREDRDLFDNARRIAAMGLKDDMKGDNAWVGQDAQRWVTRILIMLVLLEGRATPKRFWSVLGGMDSDDECLKSWGRMAENLPYDVHGTLVELYRAKKESEKTYAAVMGKIKSDFDWLSSPQVADTLSGDTDILSMLAKPDKKIAIYYILKSGSADIMEGLTRMVVGIAMLHCMRSVNGAHPTFYLEEAATCGKASFISQAVSECRKYFHTILIYQSMGQVVKLFGKDGAQEIFDNLGMQVFLGGGIRDYDSAKKIADSIGKATILLDDPMAQHDRRFKAEKAWRDSLLHGGDLLEVAEEFEHERKQSHQGRYIQRYQIDPAETMRMINEVIILSPGSQPYAIVAQKMINYWENPAMAGCFAPDPLFPPLDRVRVKRKYFKGYKTCKFIREAVPEHLAHWPNHCNGQIAYVAGYRTW